MASLDMSKGGDIAKNLYSVYDYMLNQLVEANLKKDATKLDEVQKLLEELRDSWKVAIKNTGGVKGGLKGGLGRA
jgi:flagellar protein FliS